MVPIVCFSKKNDKNLLHLNLSLYYRLVFKVLQAFKGNCYLFGTYNKLY